MKRTLLVSLLTFSLAGIFQSASIAQDFTRKQRYFSVGASAMAANYFGDLSPAASTLSSDLKMTRSNLGIFASRKFFPRLSGRVSLSWSRLKGDDAANVQGPEGSVNGRLQRNLSFRNDVKELALTGTFDIFPNHSSYLKRSELSPYIFAGVALFHHNPKAYYNGGSIKDGWYALQPLQTEGKKYHKMQVSVPFGVGLRHRLSNQFDLGFEIGWRRTFTDYLDDVSSNYADKGELQKNGGKAAWILADRSVEVPALKDQVTLVKGQDGEMYPVTGGVSLPGMQRGDQTHKDWYVLSGFTLTYYLAPAVKTSKFR